MMPHTVGKPIRWKVKAPITVLKRRALSSAAIGFALIFFLFFGVDVLKLRFKAVFSLVQFDVLPTVILAQGFQLTGGHVAQLFVGGGLWRSSLTAYDGTELYLRRHGFAGLLQVFGTDLFAQVDKMLFLVGSYALLAYCRVHQSRNACQREGVGGFLQFVVLFLCSLQLAELGGDFCLCCRFGQTQLQGHLFLFNLLLFLINRGRGHSLSLPRVIFLPSF